MILDYNSINSFGEVRLESTAVVDVTAGGGGSIFINAADIFLDNSSLRAGILSNFGSEGAQAGDININAKSLFVNNGGVIDNTTYGQGNTGSINILARDTVSVADDSNSGSFILNNVEAGAVGGTRGININTGSLFVKNGAQIQALTVGKGSAGNITIAARDTVSFDGRGPNDSGPSVAATLVIEGAEGEAGDINITTGTLSLSNRAQLLSNTESRGNAGNINIEARDRVSLFNASIISEVSEEGGVGNGGDINIKTGTLLLKDGSALLADLENQGSAGNIEIEARDAVILEGTGPGAQSGSLQRGNIVPNQITATVDPTAVAIDTGGRAGNISITTDSLSLTDRGFISVNTFGRGDAGSINIDARQLRLSSGAQISASTSGSGNAGNLSVVNADLVELVGADAARGIPSSLFARVTSNSSGAAGNLTVETRQLDIRDGAEISVSSFGSGAAGNLNVTAGNLRLDNGTLEATTTTGDRGNITVRSRSIAMRRGSQIATNASGDASGGNINIDTRLLIAAPIEDNDIIANAVRGRGGNININAEAIFGIQQRSQRTPLSDITATSELGVGGTVQLNSPEVDPSRDVVELPTTPVDASTLVASGCPSGAENRFVVAGRGGLPPAPGDKLSTHALFTDWATLTTPKTQNRATAGQTIPEAANTTTTPLVEATTWQFGSKGEIILTNADPAAPNSFEATPSNCPSS